MTRDGGGHVNAEGIEYAGADDGTEGGIGLAFRTRRSGHGRLGTSARGRQGPLRRRLRLLQPAGRTSPARSGTRASTTGTAASSTVSLSTSRAWSPPSRPSSSPRRRTAVRSDRFPASTSRFATPPRAMWWPDSTARVPHVETAFVLGEFYRRQGAWKFRAVGQGYGSGLEGLATDFGIAVDEPQHTPPAAAPAPPPPAPPSATMPPPVAPPVNMPPPAAPPMTMPPPVTPPAAVQPLRRRRLPRSRSG